VRIGLVENEHRIRQAARSVKRYLQGDKAPKLKAPEAAE
jgi:hypothetical protein